jgi:hypothetical protein
VPGEQALQHPRDAALPGALAFDAKPLHGELLVREKDAGKAKCRRSFENESVAAGEREAIGVVGGRRQPQGLVSGAGGAKPHVRQKRGEPRARGVRIERPLARRCVLGSPCC